MSRYEARLKPGVTAHVTIRFALLLLGVLALDYNPINIIHLLLLDPPFRFCDSLLILGEGGVGYILLISSQ